MSNKKMVPITQLLDFIVDNRGKSCPTSKTGFPLIATNCIKHSSIYPTFENIRYVTEDTLKNWFRAELKPNDILFVNKGTPGRVCLVPDPVNFCAAQDMIGLRVNKDKVYYKYLFAVLRSEYIQKKIMNYHVGVAIPHFRKSDMDNLLIPIVDMEKQIAIGDLYVLLSEKIEKNNKINSELESLAKTLYDYWFLQFEFPNEDGKPYKSSGGKMVYNEQLKKEIPEGWEVKELGSQIIENDKSSVQVNEVKNVGIIPFFTSGEDVLYYNDKMVTGLNIYMSTGGNASVKIYAGDAAYSTDTWCFNAGENTLFYYEYLTLIKQQINDNYFDGSGLKHLKKEAFKKILLYLPSKNIIKKYNKVCLSYFDLISKTTSENQELTKLRDFLLPLLMNGQVTIQDAEDKVSEVVKTSDGEFDKEKKFELWLQNQGLAARGDVDKQTLREIFDAMDENDK